MRNLIAGLVTLAWAFVVLPMAAHAQSGMVAYKPGALKAAIAQGRTVLVDYKASW